MDRRDLTELDCNFIHHLSETCLFGDPLGGLSIDEFLEWRVWFATESDTMKDLGDDDLDCVFDEENILEHLDMWWRLHEQRN